MARVFVGMGGNVGDRAAYLYGGVAGCARHGLRLVALSPVYETSPVGGPAGQPDYLNSVALFETGLDPLVVLRILQRVEQDHFRVRDIMNGPRTLDLDLLIHGDRAGRFAELVLPHPRLHERLFVLRPLADLAPDLVVPNLQKTVRLLYEERAALEAPDSVRVYAAHS